MKKAMTVVVLALLFGVLGLDAAGASGPPAQAAREPTSGPRPGATTSQTIPAPAGLTSVDVSFTGFGGLTLHGTVLAQPKEANAKPGPGVVLVTGSGSGVPREHLLTEATEFARRGIAVLIYDKRSAGYTNFRRDYSELAVDVLGAVRALRGRPGVDPAKVGVWGLSEGGWVAPLAASRSSDIAFVIVVGGNAMPPIRQQLWNETSSLRREGVSGSLIDHGKRNFARLGADAGLFAEAYFDAQDVLRHVQQPLLGVWGERDLQTPPQDNPPLFAKALQAGGNTHYTFRFFAGADHAAHETPDRGVTRGEALAPGYADLVGTWVSNVTSGRLPNADAPEPLKQDHPSVEVHPTTWWNSGWAQLTAFVLFVIAFGGYPLWALARRLRGRRTPPLTRWARLLAGAGLTSLLGMFFYLFYLMAAGRTPDPGPIVFAGRPLPWLALQALALTTVVAAIATAVTWRRTAVAAVAAAKGERIRLGMLLTAGLVFIPWALYWGLLTP